MKVLLNLYLESWRVRNVCTNAAQLLVLQPDQGKDMCLYWKDDN